MRAIRNKTHRPLKIHLAQGRVLHLGPGKEGQISTHDVDRTGIQLLLADGDIEILGEGSSQEPAPESGPVHADPVGHHPNLTVKKRGER